MIDADLHHIRNPRFQNEEERRVIRLSPRIASPHLRANDLIKLYDTLHPSTNLRFCSPVSTRLPQQSSFNGFSSRAAHSAHAGWTLTVTPRLASVANDQC